MDEYTKETLDYFGEKANEYDLNNEFNRKINALESQVRVLIIYGFKLKGEIISNDKLDSLISSIKSCKENLRYQGHPVDIKK